MLAHPLEMLMARSEGLLVCQRIRQLVSLRVEATWEPAAWARTHGRACTVEHLSALLEGALLRLRQGAEASPVREVVPGEA